MSFLAKINVLPKSVFELIAAGEVVERPSSAVKELIENSIDAGAKKITVEIKNGGVKYIRVTDDGSGIEKDDVRNAFRSHATSKISSGSDLDKIMTFGFRGEALSSIAQVSKVSILTRTADEEFGTEFSIEGGEEKYFSEAGCPVGTTVIVRDLFYNTPARMKFLKKDATESGYVYDIVSKEALSHPDVSVTFIKDNRKSFFTPGDGRILSAVQAVFGMEFQSELIYCSGGNDFIKVEGYITKPAYSRPNRSSQITFVNSRYVKIPLVASALDNAYKNTVMNGKYPACVLFISADPGFVDINVSPSKTVVRFSNEKYVYDAVYFSAVTALNNDTQILKAQTKMSDEKIFGVKKDNFVQLRMSQDTSEKIKKDTADYAKYHSHEKKSSKFDYDVFLENAENLKDFDSKSGGENYSSVKYYPPAEKEKISPVLNDSADIKYVTGENENDLSVVPDEINSVQKIGEEKKEEISPVAVVEENEKTFDDVKLVGEAFKTYIIVEKDKKLYFIDKHAAHERILFNFFSSEKNNIPSQIIYPVQVTLTQKEYEAVIENLPVFEKSGYLIDDFGDRTVIVRGVPEKLDSEDIAEILRESAAELYKGAEKPIPEKLDWIYHSTSCRAAIKEGDDISDEEKLNLARRVLSDNDIRYCPHGRPVLFELSENQLKKLFGRIV